jgi:hypothetical protein
MLLLKSAARRGARRAAAADWLRRDSFFDYLATRQLYTLLQLWALAAFFKPPLVSLSLLLGICISFIVGN